MPKSRENFWLEKFDTNINRDHQNTNKLKLLDWRVDVIWECETKDTNQVKEKILRLTNTKPNKY